ncbi:ABC transporter substrate-binding protein [Aquabacter spiritensis]|uniref:NitT/TauT family transport system substrate-binding protein n=1 Tax=Aquabacter spiritensis TaxID=933073 RepID=A0A4R3M445_9HYPH|nr:ABC transporter substrate-binding protein [Aquabacter spiritensis]TCT06107.1 NitT/TauT family transport system substrate-binding protein [Aquabacter spiritensis]
MLNRRSFNALLGAAGASLAFPTFSFAKDAAVVRLGNAAGIIDPQLVFMTVGQNPKVNYYAKEGVAMEIMNMSGAGQTLQAVASGNCETSAVSPVAFLNAYAKNPRLDVIFPYCWLREPHWSVAVKPDSPVKSLAELKGKKVGIRNQGDTGYFGARAMFQELGINPDSDVEWVAVGEGGPAGDAVYRGRVDAMAFWDASFARIAIAGFPLRQLPNTEGMKQLFGNSYGVQKSALKQNRDTVVRFFRAMAKSTVFAYANIDNAILLHWEIYPESKPKGRTEEQAMEEARIIVASRADKWMPQPWQPDQRFGAHSKEQWEAQVAFAGLEGQVKDVSGVSTKDLLDEINAFDKATVIAEAKALKM